MTTLQIGRYKMGRNRTLAMALTRRIPATANYSVGCVIEDGLLPMQLKLPKIADCQRHGRKGALDTRR